MWARPRPSSSTRSCRTGAHRASRTPSSKGPTTPTRSTTCRPEPLFTRARTPRAATACRNSTKLKRRTRHYRSAMRKRAKPRRRAKTNWRRRPRSTDAAEPRPPRLQKEPRRDVDGVADGHGAGAGIRAGRERPQGLHLQRGDRPRKLRGDRRLRHGGVLVFTVHDGQDA